jgi:hypothetical protein
VARKVLLIALAFIVAAFTATIALVLFNLTGNYFHSGLPPRISRSFGLDFLIVFLFVMVIVVSIGAPLLACLVWTRALTLKPFLAVGALGGFGVSVIARSPMQIPSIADLVVFVVVGVLTSGAFFATWRGLKH